MTRYLAILAPRTPDPADHFTPPTTATKVVGLRGYNPSGDVALKRMTARVLARNGNTAAAWAESKRAEALEYIETLAEEFGISVDEARRRFARPAPRVAP